MHSLEALFSKLSLQFQNIISNSVRMYNLTVNVFKIIRWGLFTFRLGKRCKIYLKKLQNMP